MLSSCVETTVFNERLGETPVQIMQIKRAGVEKTIVHLHENETTALIAASRYVHQYGGTLIRLHHKGQRDIHFVAKGKAYGFDPNRIYTDRGIRMTLKQHGLYTKTGHRIVKRFAAKIIALLPPGKIIAMHNNQTYSLRDYLPHHPLAKDARALCYLPDSNYRNFYFVTDSQNYKRLKKYAYNVALQSFKAQNDGSLSYYYFLKQPYINIEAAYGALATQFRMLELA